MNTADLDPKGYLPLLSLLLTRLAPRTRARREAAACCA